jgi:hypothetical protein
MRRFAKSSCPVRTHTLSFVLSNLQRSDLRRIASFASYSAPRVHQIAFRYSSPREERNSPSRTPDVAAVGLIQRLNPTSRTDPAPGRAGLLCFLPCPLPLKSLPRVVAARPRATALSQKWKRRPVGRPGMAGAYVNYLCFRSFL